MKNWTFTIGAVAGFVVTVLIAKPFVSAHERGYGLGAYCVGQADARAQTCKSLDDGCYCETDGAWVNVGTFGEGEQ